MAAISTSENYLGETPGTLALVAPFTISDAPRLVASALAAHKAPIVFLHSLIVRPDKTMAPGWQDTVRAVVEATPEAIGYYALDEPGLFGVSDAVQDELVALLPKDKIIMVSLSPPELDAKQYVSPGVNLLGANLYSSAGVTPAAAKGYLDKLATYGRPMYLNLDAMRIGQCSSVTDADQHQAIAVNDSILLWGAGRDIRAYVAFLWQSYAAGPEPVCGARDLPIIRGYVDNLVRGQ